MMMCLSLSCAEPAYQQLQGRTMGTYYAVQFAAGAECQLQQADLDGILGTVNNSMSTYQSDSELSELNRNLSIERLTISAGLAEVLAAAEQVWRDSHGAFDVTVGPLVNLWGFGPQTIQHAPSAQAQAEAAARVGMNKLKINGTSLQKAVPDLSLDLSALAKGYAVDRISEALSQHGCNDFMVDIGGEIRVAGFNPQQQHWRIGIEVPDARQLGTLQTVLELTDMSIATSGDYRNFQMLDGVRVDHVIDPRQGKPASNDVVSATVLHPSAMMADAYATSLMVLGMEAGLAFADQLGVPAYIMSREPGSIAENRDEDVIKARYNTAMQAYLRQDN